MALSRENSLHDVVSLVTSHARALVLLRRWVVLHANTLPMTRAALHHVTLALDRMMVTTLRRAERVLALDTIVSETRNTLDFA